MSCRETNNQTKRNMKGKRKNVNAMVVLMRHDREAARTRQGI